MYALSISESNFCRGEETSDLGVVGERMAVIMRREFTGSMEAMSGPKHVVDHDHPRIAGRTDTG